MTPSPAVTVIIALPAPTATTLPSASTVTTDSLSDEKVGAKSPGSTVATIESLPPTVKSNSLGPTVKLVLIISFTIFNVNLLNVWFLLSIAYSNASTSGAK